MKGIFSECVDESSQKSKWEEFRKFAKGDITKKCSDLLRDMELTESEEEDSYVGEDVVSLTEVGEKEHQRVEITEKDVAMTDNG